MLKSLLISPVSVSFEIRRGLHSLRPAPSLGPTAAWTGIAGLFRPHANPINHQPEVEEPCISHDGSVVQPTHQPKPSVPPRLPKGLSKLHLQVMHTIRSRGLIQPKSSILVAVSGGQARSYDWGDDDYWYISK